MKPYELWTTKGRGEKLVGTYNTLPKLKRAWERHVAGHGPLKAVQIVGEEIFIINDQMPPHVALELKEFRSSQERDAHIIENARYFTIVRFLGVGRYERHERDVKAEALDLAERLSQENKANYMIYAVGPQDWSAFVQSVIYRRT